MISVILPVYNVEKYLYKCFQSIQKQTLSDFEAIIIVDGATDKSYEIAEEFCATDSRFLVYWQENSGSGPARNNGLSKAKGEYIAFVDPDDFIIPTYLESLLRCMIEYDVDFVTSWYRTLYTDKDGALSGMSEVDVDGNYLSEQSVGKDSDIVVKGRDKVRKNWPWLIMNDYVDSPHCKLFKKSIIDANNLRFPALRRSQDIVFNISHFGCIDSYCIMSKREYVYRIIEGAMAKRIPLDYYKTYTAISKQRHGIMKEWGVDYDKKAFASYEYKYVFSILTSLYKNRVLCNEFISDSHIRGICRNANIKGINARNIVRKSVDNGYYLPVALIMSVRDLYIGTKEIGRKLRFVLNGKN